MKKYIPVLLVALFPSVSFAEDQNIYPLEIQKFISDKIACKHFAGEITGGGKRDVEVNKSLKKYCHGEDQVTELKQKYKDNEEVLSVLYYFEEAN